MGVRYATAVRVRWSDLDAYGHVNNARILTLLEEARVDWLFTEGTRRGADRLTAGMVVASFEIKYLRPIGFGPEVLVSMGVTELKAVSAVIDYHVTVAGEVVVTAASRLVPVELPGPRSDEEPSQERAEYRSQGRQPRPRRWDQGERAFLTEYLQES